MVARDQQDSTFLNEEDDDMPALEDNDEIPHYVYRGDREQVQPLDASHVTAYPCEYLEEADDAPLGRPKCSVCFHREAIVIALPCAHIATCVSCCRKNVQVQSTCIICREAVHEYKRVFIQQCEVVD
jgi:hypothetical protein